MQRSLISPAKQTALNNALIEAVKLPDKLVYILKLIADGADVNCRDAEAYTPLCRAIKFGRKEYFMELIDKGSDIHLMVGSTNTTLLMEAAGFGHYELCEYLLEKNIDPNKVSTSGKTALYFAITLGSVGHVEVCRLLLEKGAELCTINESGMSLLQYLEAARVNLPDSDAMVNLLLSYAAKKYEITEDQNILSDINAMSVVDKTIKQRFDNILTGLPAPTTEELNIALYMAARYNDDGTRIKLLLDKGADINYKNPNKRGITPLYSAACYRRNKNVEVLLARGAIINPKTKNNFSTPLMVAADYGYTDICEILLKHGTNVNDVSKENKNALYYAVRRSHLDTCQLLLSNKAEVGSACLFAAVQLTDQTMRVKMLTLLLQHLAQEYLATNNPEIIANIELVSAQEATIKNQFDTEVANLKEAAQIQLNEKLIAAAAIPDLEKVVQLIREGAEVNAETKHSITPLYRAAKNGCIENVKYLLNSNAKVNAEPNCPNVLIGAAKHGHTEICQLLIERGADTNCIGKSKTKPLYHAVKKGNVNLCLLLLNNGASPFLIGSKGSTLLGIANKLKDKHTRKIIVNMLLAVMLDFFLMQIKADTLKEIPGELQRLQLDSKEPLMIRFFNLMIEFTIPDDKIISIINKSPRYFNLSLIKDSIVDMVKQITDPVEREKFGRQILTDSDNIWHRVLEISRNPRLVKDKKCDVKKGRFAKIENLLKQTKIIAPVAVHEDQKIVASSVNIPLTPQSLLPPAYQPLYPVLAAPVTVAPPPYQAVDLSLRMPSAPAPGMVYSPVRLFHHASKPEEGESAKSELAGYLGNN